MSFPSSTDSFAGFTASHTLSTDNHASQHNSEQSAIVAIENKIGTGASTPVNNTFLAGNGTGTSTWRALTASDVGLSNVPNNTLVDTLKAVYPIGSIYIETSGTNPGTTFGFGVWAAYGQGQVLVGYKSGDSNFGTAGTTGGEATHLITASESGLPVHQHAITDPGHTHNPGAGNNIYNSISGGGAHDLGSGVNQFPLSSTTASNTTGISINNSTSANASSAHNNLQPYIVVYMWIRNS